MKTNTGGRRTVQRFGDRPGWAAVTAGLHQQPDDTEPRRVCNGSEGIRGLLFVHTLNSSTVFEMWLSVRTAQTGDEMNPIRDRHAGASDGRFVA